MPQETQTEEAPQRFAVDRAAFEQRILEGSLRDREACAVVKTHLATFKRRMAMAESAIDEGHLGCAHSYLEIGRRDYEAALKALSH